MSAIDRFDGEYRFLSNFYQHSFRYMGRTYLTAEHAFQAAKSHDPAERLAIQLATTPAGAKRLGRRASLRPDWEKVKLNVMLEIVRAKFFSSRALAERLVATGDRELIEGNTWGDTFWGVCRGRGRNHLGLILMQVRDECRKKLAS